MELLAHNFSAEFARSADLAKGVEKGVANVDEHGAKPLIAFRDAEQMSLMVRATAFVFADPHTRALHDVIERVAPSEATVLITGETGTGKELVARHVHGLSNRRNAGFVAINCGAFSETLVESELFGYERGAYTGALQGKAGWFETANGGTLFLDEIGDLPLAMQVKLLRVLQEREVVRLGARRAVPIDVRLIAATNIDLSEAVRAGRFREDLYYRLQVIALPVMPLRERSGDVLPLAHHFLSTYARRLQVDDARLTPEAERALLSYPWPGNIRELENVMHRAVLLSRAGLITPSELNLPGWHNAQPACLQPAAPPAAALALTPEPQAAAATAIAPAAAAPASEALHRAWQTLLASAEPIEFEALQQELVLAAWEHCQRNQVRTAKHLNISRNILRTYLKKAEAII
ncbi:sigma-54 dependent transcriptional regulator [Duganella sp. sic0402]|uniref:sigma-54 interaction domain-containing protein n=1 Tax=Duganella sp. sic0402 TaxID=2854786 RepID=UPI001C47D9D0|nr:sigma-54 dependent transcriptional regulator [Duganella sp. sic0402]MBV7535196.1 sigma-54 dependent transcriptional regulator [Duganella sp. sic0402]